MRVQERERESSREREFKRERCQEREGKTNRKGERVETGLGDDLDALFGEIVKDKGLEELKVAVFDGKLVSALLGGEGLLAEVGPDARKVDKGLLFKGFDVNVEMKEEFGEGGAKFWGEIAVGNAQENEIVRHDGADGRACIDIAALAEIRKEFDCVDKVIEKVWIRNGNELFDIHPFLVFGRLDEDRFVDLFDADQEVWILNDELFADEQLVACVCNAVALAKDGKEAHKVGVHAEFLEQFDKEDDLIDGDLVEELFVVAKEFHESCDGLWKVDHLFHELDVFHRRHGELVGWIVLDDLTQQSIAQTTDRVRRVVIGLVNVVDGGEMRMRERHFDEFDECIDEILLAKKTLTFLDGYSLACKGIHVTTDCARDDEIREDFDDAFCGECSARRRDNERGECKSCAFTLCEIEDLFVDV